jgi:hypothetical protein
VPKRFLIHDNDTTFTVGFDTVFQAQGIEVIHTSFQAPNANAFADDRRERQRQRWVRSVREECLDIISEWHVRRVLAEYVTFYNTRRPHQGIKQQCPVSLPILSEQGIVQRRDVLGGIIHDYLRAVA